MDIGRSFSAMFKDPRWPGKLLLAFIFPLLIVTGPAVIGYWMRYVRNVAEGHDDMLPEWNEFGAYWVRGVLVILAGIVYVFAGLLLLIIGVIPAVILLQAAVVEYAMTERPGGLFALRNVWHRIFTWTNFWIAWIVGFGLGIVSNAISSGISSPRGAAAKGLGFFVGALLGLYVSFVQANLYGQYARDAYRATPAPVPPTTYAPPPAPGGYAPPRGPQPQG